MGMDLTVNFNENSEDMVIQLPQGPLNVGHGAGTNNPAELVFASIAGCSIGVLKMILDKKKITYDKLQATGKMVIDEDVSPSQLKSVELEMRITEPSKELDILEKALGQAIENCPIVQSLKNSITVTERIKIV